jgi:hypothetical protein
MGNADLPHKGRLEAQKPRYFTILHSCQSVLNLDILIKGYFLY